MSDLAQWIRDARETVAGAGARGEHIAIRPVVLDALLDVAEALAAQEEWEKAGAEHELDCAYQPCDFRGCPHDDVWAKRDRANELRRSALARLAEVKP